MILWLNYTSLGYGGLGASAKVSVTLMRFPILKVEIEALVPWVGTPGLDPRLCG